MKLPTVKVQETYRFLATLRKNETKPKKKQTLVEKRSCLYIRSGFAKLAEEWFSMKINSSLIEKKTSSYFILLREALAFNIKMLQLRLTMDSILKNKVYVKSDEVLKFLLSKHSKQLEDISKLSKQNRKFYGNLESSSWDLVIQFRLLVETLKKKDEQKLSFEDKSLLGKPSNRKSPEFSGIFPTLVNPPPGIRENQMKMEKIFFAFLDELAHSKSSFKKVGKMTFF